MVFLKRVALVLALFVAVFAVLFFPLLRDRGSNFGDLIVTNALIYTSDPDTHFAEAMAIRGDRIVLVGNYSSVQGKSAVRYKNRVINRWAVFTNLSIPEVMRKQERRRLIGQRTQVIDLKGKVVVPGFIDSHVHLIPGGLQMVQVELKGVTNKDDFIDKVLEGRRGKEEGSWILGGGWNNELWGGDMPTAAWIDHITPNNPVWLSRVDGHMGLANSMALREAGITNATKDPIGGTIIRTPNGDPTGLLVDSAMELLLPSIPKVSVDERRNALIRASKFALTKGVTTVVDVGRYFPGASSNLVWEDFIDVYQWAHSAGRMHIRVCLFFPMETWSSLVDLKKRMGQSLGHWIYFGGLKSFADGSLGSNSALLYESYLDEPNSYGIQVMDRDWILKNATEADKLGLQIAIHAIGDKANDLVLELDRILISTNGIRDRRFRIEHAQHLTPEAASRFGEQNVVASVQPEHLLDDADTARKKLGDDRAFKESYLFQSLLASNSRIAFGSDWPVAEINPLGAIKAAMKRRPPGWNVAFNPSECITLGDALNASTVSAAYACFLDDEIGSLSPGKLADFVVLSTDSWTEFAESGSASVIATYIGGKLAYSSD